MRTRNTRAVVVHALCRLFIKRLSKIDVSFVWISRLFRTLFASRQLSCNLTKLYSLVSNICIICHLRSHDLYGIDLMFLSFTLFTTAEKAKGRRIPDRCYKFGNLAVAAVIVRKALVPKLKTLKNAFS